MSWNDIYIENILLQRWSHGNFYFKKGMKLTWNIFKCNQIFSLKHNWRYRLKITDILSTRYKTTIELCECCHDRNTVHWLKQRNDWYKGYPLSSPSSTRPAYCGRTGAVPWVLMSRLLVSPDHEQRWYSSCRIRRSLSSMRKYLIFPSYVSVKDYKTTQNMLSYFPGKLSI